MRIRGLRGRENDQTQRDNINSTSLLLFQKDFAYCRRLFEIPKRGLLKKLLDYKTSILDSMQNLNTVFKFSFFAMKGS